MLNNNFHVLRRNGNNYTITNGRCYNLIGYMPPEIVSETFDFAYRMTFARAGEHRAHRTGGSHQRKKGEIFANAFQGKLAEYALYLVLTDKQIAVSKPDLRVLGLGEWDSVDLTINDMRLSIKSTKSFGNLLLLEENDWDDKANYLPNGKGYDFTFLVRMNPFCEDILKQHRLLYSDSVDKNELSKMISSNRWEFDIPGYVTRDELIYIINNNYVIPRGSMLNGSTRMDASNYYVQSGDMHSIEEFAAIFE